MRKLRYFVGVASLMAFLNSAAVTIECTPGYLHTLLESPETETQLTVIGSLDATDMFYIAENMPVLQALDLSGATISEYNGFAFKGQRFYAADEIPMGVFAGAPFQTVSLPECPLTIDHGAFSGSALISVSIPSSVTLGEGVFAGCASLTEAVVSSTMLPAGSFNNCPELKKVSFYGTKVIGEKAFFNCVALRSLNNTDQFVSIGKDAFAGCNSLAEFDFGPELTEIGSGAFQDSGLVSADLSRATRLNSLGDWAFARSSALTELKMPSQVVSYGEGLVFDCRKLSNFTPAEATEVIGDYAFKGNQSLNVDAVLTSDVDTIGVLSFAGASSTSVIKLPASLSYIGDNAMEGMTGLQTIYADELADVPALGIDVWAGIDQSLVNLYVNLDTYESFKNVDQWCDFNIIDPASVPNIAADGASPVRGRFVGNILQIDLGAHVASTIDLYNTAGIHLVNVRPNADSLVTIDTGNWSDTVYIVSIRLADSSCVALKLARP